MSKEMDMLHGKLGGKILLFAIPLAATGILQQLFNAADVAVVGTFVGPDAMAAVGSNSAIIGLMVNLFVGISLGANVVISGFTGRHDAENVHKAVHTAVIFAPLAGVAMMLIGELISAPLLTLMGVPDKVMGMALAYLRIYLTGLPVIFLYNFEAAIFRSQGNTKTPLICLLVSGIINVILNLFFVIIVGMTADGVALATVISNVVSSALMFFMLVRNKGEIRLRREDMHVSVSLLKKMLVIGVPAGLQGMVFSLSNICIQSAINSLGTVVMAASAAAFNIEIFAYYIINSFGQACTTFTSQNRGAGYYERCRRILVICLIQGSAAALLAAVCLLVPGRELLSIFNKNTAVINYGMIRLKYIVGTQLLSVLIEVFSGCLRGHEHSAGPALMALAGVCGVRIAWVYTVFRMAPSFGRLIVVYPVSWVVTSAAIIGFYFIKRRELYHLETIRS